MWTSTPVAEPRWDARIHHSYAKGLEVPVAHLHSKLQTLEQVILKNGHLYLLSDRKRDVTFILYLLENDETLWDTWDLSMCQKGV